MNDLMHLLENPHTHLSDETLAAAHRLILNTYREAMRPRSAIKGLLKDGSSLASVLGTSTETVKRMSRARLAARIESAHIALPSQQGFDDRLNRFAEDFGLNTAERALLGLAALSEACDALNEVFDELEGFVSRDLALLASHATGLDARALRSALSPQGLLVSSGLISTERYGSLNSRLSLLEGVATALNENATAGPLAARFICAAPTSKLDFADYAHHAREVKLIRDVLEGALRTRATGVHVLLHGEPGTGKSELARLLAHSAGQAFEVPDAERDGGALAADKRLRRYTFLLRLLGSGGGRILVFDEVEELLGSFEQAGWVASGVGATAMHKSWKNRLLETATVPTIWIANQLHAIDPALLRRFALVLHVQAPPRSQRVALLEKAAGQLAHAPEVMRVLESDTPLTAADIDRARRAMELARPEGDADTFLRALALRAANPIQRERKHRFATLGYCIDWLNTTPPMADVVARLALRKSGRLCFAGAPGTGKTALAQHLAKTLGLPLHVKKASDLLGMYLGETEANLAHAFAEARREDAVLLLDEADSFLRSREHAVRSWEVTQVNQLLKEIEDHDGIVVLCTNHFAALDEAVLRRLDLKVRFERLTAVAVHEAFIAAAAVLGIAALDAEAAITSKHYVANAVALGDIAAALRQTQLRSDTPDAALLRECVDAEVAARATQKGRGIGFMAGMN